jgi:hypothetical protein
MSIWLIGRSIALVSIVMVTIPVAATLMMLAWGRQLSLVTERRVQVRRVPLWSVFSRFFA